VSTRPWPVCTHWGRDGLKIGGLSASLLAERYGTPLLLIDKEHLRARCREVHAAFPEALYAVKALTSRRLLRLIASEGLQFLAASGGELHACLRAGIPASRIALHGNHKTQEELERALAAGVRLLICDNLEEIARAEAMATRLGVRQDVLVRVVPAIAAGAHAHVITGAQDSKFGLQPADAENAVQTILQSRSLRFRGLHAHIGSQILAAEPYLTLIDRLAAFAAGLERRLGVGSDLLDIGGGFGITYVDERPLALSPLAQAMRARLTAACRHSTRPDLLVEPGRTVVGNAGLTLYRVGAVKRGAHGARLVIVDGGMTDNLRPMLYGAHHAVAAARRSAAGECGPARLVGRHCESGDVLADRVLLPKAIAAGDIVALAATGAYCYSMASNYNRVPRPAMVAVADGQAELWLRRETHDDLDRLEVIAEDSA
jgi:diaminopimelate decarboxylase